MRQKIWRGQSGITDFSYLELRISYPPSFMYLRLCLSMFQPSTWVSPPLLPHQHQSWHQCFPPPHASVLIVLTLSIASLLLFLMCPLYRPYPSSSTPPLTSGHALCQHEYLCVQAFRSRAHCPETKRMVISTHVDNEGVQYVVPVPWFLPIQSALCLLLCPINLPQIGTLHGLCLNIRSCDVLLYNVITFCGLFMWNQSL